MFDLRLGLFTSGYQRYPLEKAFADAKRFGYDYIEPEALKKLRKQSDENRLNIDWDILEHKNSSTGIELLTKMYEIDNKLSNNNYDDDTRSQQLELPEYKSRWLWQEQMRVAMMMACNIPNPKYGRLANDKLGEIINQAKLLK